MPGPTSNGQFGTSIHRVGNALGNGKVGQKVLTKVLFGLNFANHTAKLKIKN